jgi:RimJ/RimL family protein N-acetyltransferase
VSDRLDVRLPVEADRARFVELFTDDDFMVFSDGPLDHAGAHARFDEMLVRAAELPFAKQPIIERASGEIIGYAGVNRWTFEGEDRLEFGWRLVPAARGRGYATEAVEAVLAIAEDTHAGELLAIIDPENVPSARVAAKVGFTYWTEALVDGGHPVDLYRVSIPRTG